MAVIANLLAREISRYPRQSYGRGGRGVGYGSRKAARLSRPELRPVRMKPWNCATTTKRALTVRAYDGRLRM
jgi:hypothetical protein